MNRKWTNERGNASAHAEMDRKSKRKEMNSGNGSGIGSGNGLELGWKRKGNGPQMKTEMKAGMKPKWTGNEPQMDRK